MCVGHSGGVFIPSPYSCDGWVQCNLDLIHACGSCPGGFYFHPVKGICVHPSEVDCDSAAIGLCTPGVINRVPAPDSCSVYFQCIGQGSPIEQTCIEGLHFNELTEKCDLIENARCLREPITIQCPATDAAFTQEPHPFICDLFFVCINGVATESQCLEGLHFDVNLRQCQRIEEAQCIIDDGGEETGSGDTSNFIQEHYFM